MRLDLVPPVVAFVDDDAGYLAWLAANPAGYTVNTTRPPHRDYLMLHRASCRHISGSDGRRWTTSYVKICGPSREALDAWSAEQVGAASDRCSLCRP